MGAKNFPVLQHEFRIGSRMNSSVCTVCGYEVVWNRPLAFYKGCPADTWKPESVAPIGRSFWVTLGVIAAVVIGLIAWAC